VTIESPPSLLKVLLQTEAMRHVNCRTVRMEPGAHLALTEELPACAHMLLSGVASTAVAMADGSRALVRTSRRGDLLEMQYLLGGITGQHLVSVIMAGEAVRIPFRAVQQAFATDIRFRNAVLASAAAQFLATERLVACNLFHEVEERLASYLLTLQNATGFNVLPLTQELLSEELGVQRTTVVQAAGELRRKGCVNFSRGRIEVVDRDRLIKAACECYAGPSRDREQAPPESESPVHDRAEPSLAASSFAA